MIGSSDIMQVQNHIPNGLFHGFLSGAHKNQLELRLWPLRKNSKTYLKRDYWFSWKNTARVPTNPDGVGQDCRNADLRVSIRISFSAQKKPVPKWAGFFVAQLVLSSKFEYSRKVILTPNLFNQGIIRCAHYPGGGGLKTLKSVCYADAFLFCGEGGFWTYLPQVPIILSFLRLTQNILTIYPTIITTSYSMFCAVKELLCKDIHFVKTSQLWTKKNCLHIKYFFKN